jgi:hypothetical protein
VSLLEAEALREVVLELGVVGLDVWESKRDEVFVEELVSLVKLCFLAPDSLGMLACEGMLDAEVR